MLWRVILLTGVILLDCSLSGCLIIPTNYYEGYSRRNIDEEPPAVIVAGMATREEVLLKLGEPDISSEDEMELWYMATKAKGILIVGDRGGPIDVDYIHVVRFNRDGLVEALQVYNKTSNRPVNQWNNEFGTSNSLITYTYEPHFSRAGVTLPTKVE